MNRWIVIGCILFWVALATSFCGNESESELLLQGWSEESTYTVIPEVSP